MSTANSSPPSRARVSPRRTSPCMAPAIWRSSCALCYLDLDQFKVINDTCGHAAGDELLRQLAGVLRASLRQRDVIARLGGDEFAALVGDADLQGGRLAAEKLLAAVEGFRFQWEGSVFLDSSTRRISSKLRPVVIG